MLSEKRIKEAEDNIIIYLDENLLYKVKEYDAEILKIYMKNAQESLKMAKLAESQNISALWTTVCSYYAMFYSANALLYYNGYKIGEKIAHKITADALIALIRDKITNCFLENYEEIESVAQELAQLKSDSLVENFDFERNKRNKYQYSISYEIKFSKAKTSFQRAKEFVYEIQNLIRK